MKDVIFSPDGGTTRAGVIGTTGVDLELHVVGTIGNIKPGTGDDFTLEV
jgi:hypothetical protein